MIRSTIFPLRAHEVLHVLRTTVRIVASLITVVILIKRSVNVAAHSTIRLFSVLEEGIAQIYAELSTLLLRIKLELA